MVRTGATSDIIQKFRCDPTVLINDVGRCTRDIRVAWVNDIVSGDCHFVCIHEQGIRDFKGLLCRVSERQWVGTDSNQGGTFSADVFITGLQLTELRATVRSRASAVENDDERLSEIL